jgi:hypothetical protein
MIGSNSVQLTINGGGFTSNPTVNLPSGVFGSNQSATDTQIKLTVNVTYSANIGNNNISVTANGAHSNTVNLVIDGPAYMTVNYDSYGPCVGCSTTIERTVAYQVYNFSGSTTNLANQYIGEVPSVGTDTCTPQESPEYTTCSSGLGRTDGAGSFSDTWSLGYDNESPTGCGVTINSDHWQMCFSGHPKTYATLSGYVHTNSIQINGHTVPPSSGEMSPGTRINP